MQTSQNTASTATVSAEYLRASIAAARAEGSRLVCELAMLRAIAARSQAQCTRTLAIFRHRSRKTSAAPA